MGKRRIKGWGMFPVIFGFCLLALKKDDSNNTPPFSNHGPSSDPAVPGRSPGRLLSCAHSAQDALSECLLMRATTLGQARQWCSFTQTKDTKPSFPASCFRAGTFWYKPGTRHPWAPLHHTSLPVSPAPSPPPHTPAHFSSQWQDL